MLPALGAHSPQSIHPEQTAPVAQPWTIPIPVSSLPCPCLQPLTACHSLGFWSGMAQPLVGSSYKLCGWFFPSQNVPSLSNWSPALACAVPYLVLG